MVLMQLVVERESLKEADFEIQKEIFDRTVYEMRNPNPNAAAATAATATAANAAAAMGSASSGMVSKDPGTTPTSSYRYALQYPHLLEKQQPSPPSNVAHAKGGKGEYGKAKSSGLTSVGHNNR